MVLLVRRREPGNMAIYRARKRRSERRHLDSTEGVNFSGNFRVRDGNGWSLFAMTVEKHFGREQIGGGEK
ncbi:hypothetical protein [Desulfosediminicola sp.]|uniref:hypothetical protein n=2 Tax=Desulfosediminicola TaxID=2886823 RepID=UPI00268F5BEA